MRKIPIFLACLLIFSTLMGSGGALAADATGSPAVADIQNDGVQDSLEDNPNEDIMGEDVPDESGDGGEVLAAGEDASVSVTPTPTPAPTAPPVVSTSFTIEPVLGYDGLMIMNRWIPTYVTVTNHGADFEGTLGVNVFFSLNEYDRYEMPLTLAGGATKRVLLPIRPMVRQDMYAFELVQDGRIIAEQRVAPARLAAPETITIGVLSEEPQSLAYFNQRANGLDTLRGEVWLTIPLDADNFPETENLMEGFTMLVIDGFDARTLSVPQQEALASWLLKGGIVFVSGGAKAATGYPFFSQWTGLSATGIEEGEDITPQLLTYATLKGTPVDEPIWRNELPASKAFISTEDGEHGLLIHSLAGQGSIFTAAFDIGGKPLSGWAQMSSFWPRMLRQNASQMYIAMLNRTDSLRYGGNDSYRAHELLNALRVPNTQSGIPVLLLLAVYLFVVGFGGYLVLKRLDRREWLWVAAPASAIVFALLMVLLSRGSTMNDPVTLTASRVVMDAENAQVNTYIGVATPGSGELTIGTDQAQLPNVLRTDNYWYDDQSADRLYRPVDMRQRYHLDVRPSVGFISSDAWDVKMLQLTGLKQSLGTLETSMWMEDDGVHGTAINRTDYHLKHCVVVTPFGFASIGDMLPGEEKSFEMLLPTTPINTEDPEFRLLPNIMYSTLDLDPSGASSYYYDSSVNTYLDAAILEGKPYDPNSVEQQRLSLARLFEDEWNFYENRSSYYFFGFNDSIGQIQVSLNGSPVTRTAHTAVIANVVSFEPIGPTGVVMFPQGLIPAEVIIDEGPDQKARVATEEDPLDPNNSQGYNSTYLNIGSAAAIRFMLPQWDAYEIERMTLAGMSYDAMPTLYLYNNDTEKWDEQMLLSVSMEGKDWAPYIDDEGGVYARYASQDASSRYGGMSMPTISLKGRVK